jgi:2-polyprenyl-6-hydroxyphenyl methylase/3-demethylubiquinone-9 3-methyltransferase
METVYQDGACAVDARFEFGKNWRRFLGQIDQARIEAARQSIAAKLKLSTLEGLTFLDIGCGSGLFSLAARQLGAKVVSFDLDQNSVSCTQELKRRYFPNDPAWTVGQGSALDSAYLRSLGSFDVVYSWGVLHHTGSMWEALKNAGTMVKPGGKLFIAIYNDAGASTRRWTRIKRAYVTWPRPLPALLLGLCGLYYAAALGAYYISHPSKLVNRPARTRGMAVATDFVDWVGGYPFEFATPEEIFEFYQKQGFSLVGLTTRLGNACNEFVFTPQV